MEYKKALDILLKTLNKYSFDTEEILTAMGTLDFKGQQKIKKLKETRVLSYNTI